MNAPEDLAALLTEFESLREDIAFLRALRDTKILTSEGDVPLFHSPTSDNVIIDTRAAAALSSPTIILPSQLGNAGKVLTTNGTTLSWI